MRIFVDESGTFRPGGRKGDVSCVTLLVIPESAAVPLLQDFVALRSEWSSEPEIKGSSLSDAQAIAALQLLGRYDIVAEISIVDGGAHKLKQIREFSEDTAKSMIAGLSPKHNQIAVRFAHALRDEWLLLSEQLAVQMYT